MYLIFFASVRKPKVMEIFLQAKKSSKKSWKSFLQAQKSLKNMNLFFGSLRSSENMDFIFCKLQKYQKT